MSVGIYWRPIDGEKRLDVEGSESEMYETLKRVFGGDGPWQFGDGNIEKIRVLADATGEPGYERLIELVNRFGAISVFGGW